MIISLEKNRLKKNAVCWHWKIVLICELLWLKMFQEKHKMKVDIDARHHTPHMAKHLVKTRLDVKSKTIHHATPSHLERLTRLRPLKAAVLRLVPGQRLNEWPWWLSVASQLQGRNAHCLNLLTIKGALKANRHYTTGTVTYVPTSALTESPHTTVVVLWYRLYIVI